jgi:hypothetical protein
MACLAGAIAVDAQPASGEAGHNAPDDYISNIGGPPPEQVPYLKLEAHADGWFKMTNGRNGFSELYSAH